MFDRLAVFCMKRGVLQRLLDLFECFVQIFLADRTPLAPGLRGQEHRLTTSIENLGLLLRQVCVSHSGGNIFAQPQQSFAAILREQGQGNE